MALSNQAREDFKAAYREEFQKDLTDEEAEELGSQLIRFVKLILASPPSDSSAAPPCG